MRIAVVIPCLLLAGLTAFAQPPNNSCATAQTLCGQQPVGGNNTGPPGIPGLCTNTNNVVWYTFTTNSLGGVLDVDITGIDCPQVANMGNMLTALILSGDGSCTLSTFSAVPPCVSDSQDFSFTTQALNPSTQYWLTVAGAPNGGATTPAQCDFTIDVSGPGVDIVGVDYSAGSDVEIGQGGSTQLNATGPAGSTFIWSPTTGLSDNNIPNPIAAPTGSTTYTVTTTTNGCTYVDQVTVNVIRLIEPPNTLTPNGDGFNDTWEIPGINDYPGAEVVIHDRWGQIVYRAIGYREPWDGTNKGKKLSEGTYYYSIRLNHLQGQSDPYLGFSSIVR